MSGTIFSSKKRRLLLIPQAASCYFVAFLYRNILLLCSSLLFGGELWHI
jgi:hypothetical protein